MLSKAKLNYVKQSKARQSKTKQSKAKQSNDMELIKLSYFPPVTELQMTQVMHVVRSKGMLKVPSAAAILHLQ